MRGSRFFVLIDGCGAHNSSPMGAHPATGKSLKRDHERKAIGSPNIEPASRGTEPAAWKRKGMTSDKHTPTLNPVLREGPYPGRTTRISVPIQTLFLSKLVGGYYALGTKQLERGGNERRVACRRVIQAGRPPNREPRL